MSDNRLSLVNFKTKCSCYGHTLDKLVQPGILTLLTKQELHGYKLIQGLESGLLPDNTIDSTGIYRTLKKMEESGLVVSKWDTAEGGPAKRVYRITPAGRDCLSIWIQTLEHYKQHMETLIASAHQALHTSTLE